MLSERYLLGVTVLKRFGVMLEMVKGKFDVSRIFECVGFEIQITGKYKKIASLEELV